MTEPKNFAEAGLAARLDMSNLPRLSQIELGHLRHIHNLAAQPPGDWSHMGGVDPWQEMIDAYRYQLAHLAYATGLAHYHHLPAARGVFRNTFRKLIEKMLRRDVWGFWRESSKGSPAFDPSLGTVRKEGFVDPVGRENIMYSGHLAAMVGMYSVLFDDDRYFDEGSLTFEWRVMITGDGPFRFAYDFHSLNQAIYWQMVENGYLGVACEPNCVFFVCNQFPILAFRFEDIRKGSNVAGEVTAEYYKAWETKGLRTESGLYPDFWMIAQDRLVSGPSPAGSSWANSIMNAWNSEIVRGGYARQIERLFPLAETGEAIWFGRDAQAVAKAELRQNGMGSLLGFTAMLLSEMGDERLGELCSFADTYMSPTWSRGGLYYPRQDAACDPQGRFVAMDALAGNALLAYARLNVEDGMKTLYQQPWSDADFAAPKVDDVIGCELATALYDRRIGRLATRLTPSAGADARDAVVRFDLNGETRPWRLFVDRQLAASSGVGAESDRVRVSGREIQLSVEVAGDVEIVLLIE